MNEQKPVEYEENFINIEDLIKIRAKALSLSKNYFNLSNDEAEDVSQEICLSFLRNYEKIENLDSWIFGAVKRQVAYHKRKEKKLNLHPNFQNYNVEQSIIFLNLVQKLNSLCRKIIVHILFFGFTERETSDILKMKHATLHNRKKDCLMKLFKLFIGDRI